MSRACSLPAPALGRHLLENRRRQELTVRALERRRGLLQLALEPLRRRHERGDDAGQRLARHVIGAAQQRRAPGAANHAFDVGSRQLPALRNRRHVLDRQPRSELLRQDDEHLTNLVLVGRIEQRNVHLRPPLALEIDRQQVGTGGEQHPDDAAAVLRVAHLRRDHAEHTARRAGIAVLLAAAERRVGLVDDNDDRPHGAQHGQHALEIAFGLADILGSEVLEDHARHADLAADALREKRLAGADRTAQQIPHRQAIERAALEQRRVFPEPHLRGLVARRRCPAPTSAR